MPATARCEWQLTVSRQQSRYNLLALLLLIAATAISGLVLAVKLLFVVSLLALGGWLAIPSATRVQRLGYSVSGDHQDQQRHWWVERQGKRTPVRWVSGSVRRSDLLILCWSFWPWNRLVLRRDSFASEEEFRQLKCALYGSL